MCCNIVLFIHQHVCVCVHAYLLALALSAPGTGKHPDWLKALPQQSPQAQSPFSLSLPPLPLGVEKEIPDGHQGGWLLESVQKFLFPIHTDNECDFTVQYCTSNSCACALNNT